MTAAALNHPAQGDANAHLGRSKEKRSHCPLATLALVLDASGFPKRSEIFAGNISELKTLSRMLEKLAGGRARSAPTVVFDASTADQGPCDDGSRPANASTSAP